VIGPLEAARTTPSRSPTEGDLAAQLDRDCHVAVYGIEFDFDKSTMRADSEPALQKVLAILNARPDLKLEIQGHTDNVGSNNYNQKLSETRAASVVAWLTRKGIAPGRLTPHGYGITQPIADNGSDEGRAPNRRVELKKQACTAQRPGMAARHRVACLRSLTE
jgi:OmpA-OmpF porin, OOP family